MSTKNLGKVDFKKVGEILSDSSRAELYLLQTLLVSQKEGKDTSIERLILKQAKIDAVTLNDEEKKGIVAKEKKINPKDLKLTERVQKKVEALKKQVEVLEEELKPYNEKPEANFTVIDFKATGGKNLKQQMKSLHRALGRADGAIDGIENVVSFVDKVLGGIPPISGVCKTVSSILDKIGEGVKKAETFVSNATASETPSPTPSASDSDSTLDDHNPATDFKELEDHLVKKLDKDKSDILEKLAGVRKETKEQIEAHHKELKSQIQETQKEITSEMKNLEQNLGSKIDGLGETVREVYRDEIMREKRIDIDAFIFFEEEAPTDLDVVKVLYSYHRYVLIYGEEIYNTLAAKPESTTDFLKKLYRFQRSFFFDLTYQLTAMSKLIPTASDKAPTYLIALDKQLSNIELQLQKHPCAQEEFRKSLFMTYNTPTLCMYAYNLSLCEFYEAYHKKARHLTKGHEHEWQAPSTVEFKKLKNLKKKSKESLEKNLKKYFKDDKDNINNKVAKYIEVIDNYVTALVKYKAYLYRSENVTLSQNNCWYGCGLIGYFMVSTNHKFVKWGRKIKEKIMSKGKFDADEEQAVWLRFRRYKRQFEKLFGFCFACRTGLNNKIPDKPVYNYSKSGNLQCSELFSFFPYACLALCTEPKEAVTLFFSDKADTVEKTIKTIRKQMKDEHKDWSDSFTSNFCLFVEESVKLHLLTLAEYTNKDKTELLDSLNQHMLIMGSSIVRLKRGQEEKPETATNFVVELEKILVQTEPGLEESVLENVKRIPKIVVKIVT